MTSPTTPPDKCPACGYDGSTSPYPYPNRVDGHCHRCGVVWWEHRIAELEGDVAFLRDVSIAGKDALLAEARERIAELKRDNASKGRRIAYLEEMAAKFTWEESNGEAYPPEPSQ